MKRNKSSLDCKSYKKNEEQKKPCCTLILSGERCYRIEIITSGYKCYPNKTKHQEYDRNMRLNQVIHSCFDGCHLVVLENNNQKRRNCHDFPDNQKNQTVLYHTKAYQ